MRMEDENEDEVEGGDGDSLRGKEDRAGRRGRTPRYRVQGGKEQPRQNSKTTRQQDNADETWQDMAGQTRTDLP